MADLADLTVRLGINDDLSSGLDGIAGKIDDNIGKITTLGAVGGAALEGFARSQQDTNVAFERMGRVTGDGAQAMRDMAGDLHNVTFPMGEVVALMETATKRGLEGDAIADYASFWDMVGDATGESGPALGEAAVALGLVGIAAGEEAEALDAFGYITDSTTGSVEGFLKFIERTAGELGDSTPNVNDMAGALGALEESGYSSQRAQRELRTALNETDGDMVAALETLGVSEDAFNSQVSAVEASSGAIEANAQAYAGSFTPMQKMQSAAEGLMTKYGGLADAAGMMAVPMLALGPVAKGVSLGLTGITSGIPKLIGGIGSAVTAIGSKIAALAAWGAATVAQGARAVASMAVTAATTVAHWAMMGVQSLIHAAKMAAAWVMAMGPVGWVIAAVVALVALIVANWDTVVEWTTKAWNWVVDLVVGAWKSVSGNVKAGVDKVVSFVTNLRDKAVQIVTALVTAYISMWANLLSRVVGFATSLRDRVVGFVTSLRDRAVSALADLLRLGVQKVTDLRTKLVGIATTIRDKVVEFFNGLKTRAVKAVANLLTDGATKLREVRTKMVEIATGIRDKVVEFFDGLKTKAIEKVTDLVTRVKGLKDDVLGALSGAASWLYDSGKKIIQGLIDGIKNMAGNVKSAISNVLADARKLLPFSPAKEGPFSGRGWTKFSGESLVEGLADGIDRKARLVRTSVHDLAAMAQAEMAADLSVGTSLRAGSLGSRSQPQLHVYIHDGDVVRVARVEAEGVVAEVSRDRAVLAEGIRS